MKPFGVILMAVVAATGCARTGSQAFRTRAAEDLNCPASELYIEHKWEGDQASKKASGCGREALYERTCEREGCLWKRKQ